MHVTHPRHLRGLEDVTVHLLEGWHTMDAALLAELVLLHESGVITVSPERDYQMLRAAMERALERWEERERV